MGMPSTDTDELAKFGYKQELDRSLGLFSSFAAGFSYISIMTGVFELFFFGFGSGGPAFIWTWPAVFIGQMLVALCFAELAGQYPLAGSVYQWSKQIARPFTSFFGGWILTVGSIVTLAAVAVAYQVVLPQISSFFEFIGGPADIGLIATPDGAKNALLLAAGLVVFTTIINMIGVKLMARINNFGVMAELIGVTLLIILLAFHIRRSPAVVFDTFGTGAGLSVGLLRRLPGGRADERVRDVRVRHRRVAGRGDQQPAEARPARDHPRADRGRDRRLPGHLVRRDGRAEHPRQGTRHVRAALPGQGHPGRPARQRLPDRLGDRDHRVRPGRAHRRHPDDLHDGPGRQAAVRLGRREGARPVQDAAGPLGRHRRADHRAAGAERGQPAGVLRAHLGRDHHVLPRLPVRHRAAADRAAARQMAVARARPLLLAGPLGTAGEPDWPWSSRSASWSTWPGRAPAVYGADHWYFQWGAFTFTGVLGVRGRRLLPGQAPRQPGDSAGRAPGRPHGNRGRRRRRGSRSLTRCPDIAGFLGSFPPFDAVGADDLARIAAVTETEVIPRGKTIFSAGRRAGRVPWMVRSGSVEIIHDGRVLDLLGPGELFGHASMISGLPTGFEARAAEDTVCYRIPADVMRPLLARPDVLRFVARSIVDRAVPRARRNLATIRCRAASPR